MSSTVTNKKVTWYLSNSIVDNNGFSWKFSGWLKATSWLVHVLLQKWISGKSSPAPAQTNSHWWYFVPLWFLRWHTKAPSYSWLKLTGAPWMAWVALQWWKAHAKYRHFQPIWTQSQHRTPICTLIRLLKCLLKLSMGSFLLCLEYASCTSSSTTDISNRPVIGSIPLLLLCTPTWNSCFTWRVIVCHSSSTLYMSYITFLQVLRHNFCNRREQKRNRPFTRSM